MDHRRNARLHNIYPVAFFATSVAFFLRSFPENATNRSMHQSESHFPRWKICALMLLLIASCFVWYAVFAESREGLDVYVLDVGQGDSIFIQTEYGVQVLIDGGPGDAALAELGKVLPFYDRSLDVVMLTHPDADHLNGLVEIIKRYKVGMVVETGVLKSTAQYEEWNRLVEEQNIPVVYAVAGERFDLGADVSMKIVSPTQSEKGSAPSKVNNTSIIARLDYKDVSFLFTGDVEAITERKLAFLSNDLDTDILKAAHHGSKTSSSEEFLRRVTPAAAVISVGRNNRYGHPSPEIISRFDALGIPVYRTDMNGTIGIHVFPDGTYMFW